MIAANNLVAFASALAPTADDAPYVIVAVILIVAILALLIAMRRRNR